MVLFYIWIEEQCKVRQTAVVVVVSLGKNNSISSCIRKICVKQRFSLPPWHQAVFQSLSLWKYIFAFPWCSNHQTPTFGCAFLRHDRQQNMFGVRAVVHCTGFVLWERWEGRNYFYFYYANFWFRTFQLFGICLFSDSDPDIQLLITCHSQEPCNTLYQELHFRKGEAGVKRIPANCTDCRKVILWLNLPSEVKGGSCWFLLRRTQKNDCGLAKNSLPRRMLPRHTQDKHC